MAEGRGCLKKVLVGCGGALAAVILLVVIVSSLAFREVSRRQKSAPVLAPLDETVLQREDAGARPLSVMPPLGRPGRIVLVLGQGEFSVEPAAPDAGPSAEAKYDPDYHEFVETYELLADSTWVYKVGFRRIKSGFGAFLEAIFGNQVDAKVDVRLPRDWPLELDLQGEEGGIEMELGGLWLTTAELHFKKGGITVDIDEPLREPMDALVIKTSMGGCDAKGLGNASPRTLTVNCGMGGASLDLDGEWSRPCTADFVVTMGGIAVLVPDDLEANDVTGAEADLVSPPAEVDLPVLNYTLSAKMGEIDVTDR